MPSWRSGSPSSRGTERRGSGNDRGHREDTVGSTQGPRYDLLTNKRFHRRNVRVFDLFDQSVVHRRRVFATGFRVG